MADERRPGVQDLEKQAEELTLDQAEALLAGFNGGFSVSIFDPAFQDDPRGGTGDLTGSRNSAPGLERK
jgi:hypothetical protein